MGQHACIAVDCGGGHRLGIDQRSDQNVAVAPSILEDLRVYGMKCEGTARSC